MKIYSDKLKAFEHECPGCNDGTQMLSTGYLLSDKISKWIMEFKCSHDGEICRLWNIEYENKIKKALKDNGIEE